MTDLCICPDPRLTLGENADVRYPVEFDPACPLHRPAAPELSPAEAAIVARFDAAPVPPEVVAAARAITDMQRELAEALRWSPLFTVLWPGSDTIAAALIPTVQRLIANAKRPAEEAVERVEALADAIENDWEAVYRDYEDDDTASIIRAALASPAPAPIDKGTGMGEGVQ